MKVRFMTFSMKLHHVLDYSNLPSKFRPKIIAHKRPLRFAQLPYPPKYVHHSMNCIGLKYNLADMVCIWSSDQVSIFTFFFSLQAMKTEHEAIQHATQTDLKKAEMVGPYTHRIHCKINSMSRCVA